MRIVSIFILILLPLVLPAQDITGVWKGYLLTMDNKLSYEMVISEQEKDLNGYALTVFIVNGVENQGIKSIRLKEKNGSYHLEDDELIFNTYTTPPQRVKLSGLLSLSGPDSGMILTGSFTTRSLDRRASSTRPYSGTIYLKKQDPGQSTQLTARLDQLRLLNSLSFMQKKPVNRNDVAVSIPSKPAEKDQMDTVKGKAQPPVEQPVTRVVPEETWAGLAKPKSEKFTLAERERPALSPAMAERNTIVTITPPPPVIEPVAAAELEQRKTEVIRTIPFSADSIVLTLYDNGTVDGDTVSVVLNGNVILPRRGLTTNAIRLVIPASSQQGDSLMLVMYAENLGSIPPNTGLLIIQDGDQRHEVRFAGDLQKSSAVVLRRKKGF